jgi:hypothetical protein
VGTFPGGTTYIRSRPLIDRRGVAGPKTHSQMEEHEKEQVGIYQPLLQAALALDYSLKGAQVDIYPAERRVSTRHRTGFPGLVLLSHPIG